MAVRGAGIGGGYLGSFLESYRLAQELARREQQGQEASGLRALQLQEFLRQRQEEQAGRATLADIIGRQQSRVPAAAAPVSVSTAPFELGGAGVGAMDLPMEVPQPGGGTGQLIPAEAARPPVLSALMQGVEPAQAARLLSSQQFRQALKPVEEAEEDRRKAEDIEQAREFEKAAGVEAQAGNLLGFADNYGAALRRRGRHQEAAEWTKYGIAVRQKKDDEAKARTYGEKVATAAKAWDDDDSPEHWDTLLDVLASAEPGIQKAYGDTVSGKFILDRMKDNKVPLPIKAVDREYLRLTLEDRQAGRVPDDVATWGKAYARFPQYAGRHFEWWMTQKGGVPESLKKFLRLPDTDLEKNLVGDASKSALARFKVEFPALSIATPEGQKKYRELRQQEIESRETPAAKAARELDEEKKKALQGTDLQKMNDTQLGQQVQRLLRAAESADSDETERGYRELADVYMKELRRRRGVEKPGAKTEPGKGKVTVKGVAVTPPPAAPTEAAALSEAKRLMKAGFSKDEAIKAMQSAGWDVN